MAFIFNGTHLIVYETREGQVMIASFLVDILESLKTNARNGVRYWLKKAKRDKKSYAYYQAEECAQQYKTLKVIPAEEYFR